VIHERKEKKAKGKRQKSKVGILKAGETPNPEL
jgi:hypothetical protein